MDYNDIKTRLERVYSSIKSRFDNDVIKHQKVERNITETVASFKISFDKGLNASDAENKIFTIIHNLANLKDNLKKSLYDSGGNEQDIENEINSSLHLQLILDLSNQDKHGYPLTKTKRSLKDPQIKNIAQSLSLGSSGPNSSSSYSINPFTGQSTMSGDCKTVINAEIVDSSGNLIIHLDELINASIAKWEEVIKKYNIN
jgi:hypothetical protein